MNTRDSALVTLAVVIPCYNEEDVLPETFRRLSQLLGLLGRDGKISDKSAIYLIDDGSSDRSWELIERFALDNPHIVGVKLSRNFGHQNALLAGLFTAEGDAIVSADADLQDDLGAISEMVDRFREGAEIVYGVRRSRARDNFFKRGSAAFFYRLMRALGAESIDNHADFRLMSRRAVESLRQYREVNLFLRGVVPLLGFRSEIVYFDRDSRFAGVSKYSLRRMLGLALQAITSFSIVPLRVIAVSGILVFLGSLVVSVWALRAWFGGDVVPGWASIVLPLYLLGGIQLLSIGVIGEYLGRVYSEVKSRPRYFVERVVNPKRR